MYFLHVDNIGHVFWQERKTTNCLQEKPKLYFHAHYEPLFPEPRNQTGSHKRKPPVKARRYLLGRSVRLVTDWSGSWWAGSIDFTAGLVHTWRGALLPTCLEGFVRWVNWVCPFGRCASNSRLNPRGHGGFLHSCPSGLINRAMETATIQLKKVS